MDVADAVDTRIMRRVTAMTLGALLAAPILAGCRIELPLGGLDPAAGLLALAPIPPGALEVSGLPGEVFSRPAVHPACEPLDVRTSFWTSSLTGPQVVEYVMTHPGPHLEVDGTGSETIKGVVIVREVMLRPKSGTSGTHAVSSGQRLVVYEIDPLPRGVGIRVDAEVIPAGARCTSS